MTHEPVRIGFVGCGGIARGHLQALADNAQARVVATCDVNEEAARKAAALSDATVYTDYKKMLDAETLDAVYMCVPPFIHGDLEFAVIEKGLPFFVQKPVALDLKLANRIAAAVRAKNLITCVGYQLRYFGTADLAREAISGRQVGIVEGAYWCGSGRAGVPAWWLRQEQSGGQLVEQCTHVVDMMRFLVGEIDEVFSWQNQVLLPPERTNCPDITAASFRFANGALGTLACTMAGHPDDWSHANVVDIGYDQSRLHWSGDTLRITTGRDVEEQQRQNQSIDVVFVEAVRTGDASQIRSDYDDGLRTLAVTLAAGEAAAQGRPIRVSDYIASHA